MEGAVRPAVGVDEVLDADVVAVGDQRQGVARRTRYLAVAARQRPRLSGDRARRSRRRDDRQGDVGGRADRDRRLRRGIPAAPPQAVRATTAIALAGECGEADETRQRADDGRNLTVTSAGGPSVRSAPAAPSRRPGTRRRRRARAALGDRPHDQALAAAHVAGDEDPGHRGHERVIAGDVPRPSNSTPSCSSHSPRSGPRKPIASSTRSAVALALRAVDLDEAALAQLDLVDQQRPHVAVAVVDEALGVDAEDALAALLVGRRYAVDQAPLRPRVVDGVVGWAGHDLELRHRGGTLAVHRPEAVGPGVAPADDHDVLARRRDRPLVEVPSWTRFDGGRYSIAWWMPASLPRHRQARHAVARRRARLRRSSPAARRCRCSRRRRRWCGTRVPSASIWASRRSRWRFSILNSGIP